LRERAIVLKARATKIHMEPFELIVVIALVLLVAFQAWLTVRVFRSRMFDHKQKMLQTQLIWLVPIVGASLVFTVLREEESIDKPTRSQIKH
jgi:hypothetical protein